MECGLAPELGRGYLVLNESGACPKAANNRAPASGQSGAPEGHAEPRLSLSHHCCLGRMIDRIEPACLRVRLSATGEDKLHL